MKDTHIKSTNSLNVLCINTAMHLHKYCKNFALFLQNKFVVLVQPMISIFSVASKRSSEQLPSKSHLLTSVSYLDLYETQVTPRLTIRKHNPPRSEDYVHQLILA